MSQPVMDAPLAANATAPASDGVAARLSEPFTIAGYEILSELGRGGMGVVYKARQTKLHRLVALKMILAGGHAGAAELARFQTEAEAIARLRHPNIVQVYEVGEHEGKPYFSLEFCGGGSLKDKLNGTPLPAREAGALIETLARAMQAAHEHQIIHRDLKPANVLLLEDGTPKITDFGLAKKLDEAGQTHSGAIMGTPSYMAPEQAGYKPDAQARGIGPLADVYALGAILYECLTGRPPFKAATALDTILQVVSDEPVPPSQLQSKTPRDLETVCLKCLRKGPNKRYDSAAALAEDLRRFQVNEPIRARPVGSIERTVKWIRRKPILTAFWAVTVLLVGTLAIGGPWVAVYQAGLRTELEKRHQETVKARDDAERESFQARTAKYGIGMNFAWRELRGGNPGRASQLLDNSESSMRGWEYAFLRHCDSLRSLEVPNRADCLALAPDGRHLAVLREETPYDRGEGPLGSTDISRIPSSRLGVWDIGEGKPLFSIPLPGVADEEALVFDSTGQRVALGIRNRAMIVDARTGKQLFSSSDLPGDITCVSLSPDGKWLAAGYIKGIVRVWDTESGKAVWEKSKPSGFVVGQLRFTTYQVGQTFRPYSPVGRDFERTVSWRRL
jgi:tRNA A-37 threonylcarbamoyl transferase component Bud32